MKLMATLLAIVGLTVAANGADLTIDSWFNVPTLYGGQANITLDGSQRLVNAGQLRATVGGSGLQWISYCTDPSVCPVARAGCLPARRHILWLPSCQPTNA